MIPGVPRRNGQLFRGQFETDLGAITTLVNGRAIVHRLNFSEGMNVDAVPGTALAARASQIRHIVREVRSYLAGRSERLDLRIDLSGTSFQLDVWRAVRRVRRGRTMSFGELAALIGRPTAVRATARAVAVAPIELVVPTHRIIGSSGRPIGPAPIADRKRRLLRIEGAWDDVSERAATARRSRSRGGR